VCKNTTEPEHPNAETTVREERAGKDWVRREGGKAATQEHMSSMAWQMDGMAWHRCNDGVTRRGTEELRAGNGGSQPPASGGGEPGGGRFVRKRRLREADTEGFQMRAVHFNPSKARGSNHCMQLPPGWCFIGVPVASKKMYVGEKIALGGGGADEHTQGPEVRLQ